jgi:hypothetical protein
MRLYLRNLCELNKKGDTISGLFRRAISVAWQQVGWDGNKQKGKGS